MNRYKIISVFVRISTTHLIRFFGLIQKNKKRKKKIKEKKKLKFFYSREKEIHLFSICRVKKIWSLRINDLFQLSNYYHFSNTFFNTFSAFKDHKNKILYDIRRILSKFSWRLRQMCFYFWSFSWVVFSLIFLYLFSLSLCGSPDPNQISRIFRRVIKKS